MCITSTSDIFLVSLSRVILYSEPVFYHFVTAKTIDNLLSAIVKPTTTHTEKTKREIYSPYPFISPFSYFLVSSFEFHKGRRCYFLFCLLPSSSHQDSLLFEFQVHNSIFYTTHVSEMLVTGPGSSSGGTQGIHFFLLLLKFLYLFLQVLFLLFTTMMSAVCFVSSWNWLREKVRLFRFPALYC